MTELYPHFLHRAEEFAASEAYWAELCASVLRPTGESAVWFPWLHREADGNPIYDLICPPKRLAFRVVQVPDDGAASRFAWWTEDIEVGIDALPNGRYRELVFRCTLTDDTVNIARPLFTTWVADGRVPQTPD